MLSDSIWSDLQAPYCGFLVLVSRYCETVCHHTPCYCVSLHTSTAPAHVFSNSWYLLSFSFHFVAPRPVLWSFMTFFFFVTFVTPGICLSNVCFLPPTGSWLPFTSALCLQAGVQALPLTQVSNKSWFHWGCHSLGTCEGNAQLRPISAEGQQDAVHPLCRRAHPRAGFCPLH